MIIVEKRKSKKIKFDGDYLGRLPGELPNKSFMQVYHTHEDFEPVYTDESMGWGFKIKIPKPKGWFKGFNKFVSQAAKVIGKVAKPAVKFIKGVGDVTEDVIEAARKSAISVIPYDIRKYAKDILINPVTLVKFPAATVKKTASSVSEIAGNIIREVGKPVEKVYKGVARPAFRIARNIANETIWRPVHLVVDKTILPVLPKSIRDKVDEIMDIPAKAFRGKLTDKEVLEGLKAYGQLTIIPYKVVGKFNNDVINTLKKDAILGPFLEKVDLYTGGLLTSGQNLMAMPDDIYHDRMIDWKARLIDALKIYLATVTAASISKFATGVGFNAVGAETGLNQTSVGRGILVAGRLYAGKFGADDALKDSFKEAAVQTAKNETINHAVSKGYIDNKALATMILSAGVKVGTAAYQGSQVNDPYLGDSRNSIYLDSAMSSVYDKEFQNAFASEAQRLTGAPLEFRHLVDIYNTKWPDIGASVSGGINAGFFDSKFLSTLGNNILNEFNRIPANTGKIASNVMDELSRSPENMAKFAQAVAAEANRTPENIVNIANNIARESARAAQNVATEAVKAPEVVVEVAKNVATETAVAAENVVKEVVRTPENVAEVAKNVATETVVAAENVARETVRAGENIIDEAARTPGNVAEIAENVGREVVRAGENILNEAARVQWDDLIRRFGPQIMAYLQSRYPGFSVDMPPTTEMINDLELRFGQKQKKSNTGLIIAGIVAAAAVAYVASED
jgi:hypothetical protein